jgi:hypothetical protein
MSDPLRVRDDSGHGHDIGGGPDELHRCGAVEHQLFLDEETATAAGSASETTLSSADESRS